MPLGIEHSVCTSAAHGIVLSVSCAPLSIHGIGFDTHCISSPVIFHHLFKQSNLLLCPKAEKRLTILGSITWVWTLSYAGLAITKFCSFNLHRVVIPLASSSAKRISAHRVTHRVITFSSPEIQLANLIGYDSDL